MAGRQDWLKILVGEKKTTCARQASVGVTNGGYDVRHRHRANHGVGAGIIAAGDLVEVVDDVIRRPEARATLVAVGGGLFPIADVVKQAAELLAGTAPRGRQGVWQFIGCRRAFI